VRAVLVALFLLAGCGDDIRGNISVSVPEAWSPAMAEFVSLTNYSGLSLGSGGDFRIEITDDATIPAEGYRITIPVFANSGTYDGPLTWFVATHDVLGAQYGTAAVLESLGFRFRHPFETLVPRPPREMTHLDDELHQPQIRVRGLHLHTLHPIEGHFAFWIPSPAGTSDAHRIIDWIIKNRGNYVQYAALNDIIKDPEHLEKWKVFTRELIDYAHMRGIRIGINMQLFGNSNLQLAFTLSDRDEADLSAAISGRLPMITRDLPFDVYDLSFGEFFGSEPQKFIDSTNEVARQLTTLAPQAEPLHTLVHVDSNQRVSFMGRDLPYYFLVQYADPSIIPDIHTVMYFNMYDSTAGAYQHENFDEHKKYLLDRVCAGQKVAYHPETAYWVAFDDSVPMYLPVYVYSRWRDLAGIAADGCGKPLDEHLIFSTGWEWGYWLHDVAALQSSYELPATPNKLVEDAFANDLGRDAAQVVEELMTVQKQALMDDRLTAYVIGRDISIDTGRMLDPPIISQPDRLMFDEINSSNAAMFTSSVIEPLRAYTTKLGELDDKIRALSLPDSRWGRELRDGFAVTRLRAEFVLATWEAVLDKVNGGSGAEASARAEAALAAAKVVITARHRDLHDRHGGQLTGKTPNSTFYQYGYLYMADTQCFWNRELIQMKRVLGTSTEVPPGCLFNND
jgi:hypothetical protein